ncbi:MAG: hypothetical protein U1G08_06765 [Verrucomicrobiota bacterium]
MRRLEAATGTAMLGLRTTPIDGIKGYYLMNVRRMRRERRS